MATLAERLVEAESAYHDLLIGKAAVRFRDQNGEEVTYTTANRGALAAYIADIKRQISGTSSEAPLRPFYL